MSYMRCRADRLPLPGRTGRAEKGKQRLGKQKTETEGGKAGVEQEETEETETDGRLTNARPQVLGESAIIVIVLLEGSQGLVEGVPGDHLEHVHQPFVPTVQAHFVRTGSEFVCFVCFVVSVGAVPFLLPVFPSSLFFCIPWLAISGPGAFKVQGSGFKVQGSRFKVQGSRFKVRGSRFKVQGSRFKVQGSRFKVQGSRFEVQGSRFKVQGSGFKVQGSGFKVQGSGFKVQGSRFKVQGSRFRVRGSGVQRVCRHTIILLCCLRYLRYLRFLLFNPKRLSPLVISVQGCRRGGAACARRAIRCGYPGKPAARSPFGGCL